MNGRDILLLQEAERKRIAGELHDTTIQDMVCLSQQLELISLYMDQDVTRAKLETAVTRKKVKHMINEIREIVYDLRPVIMDDIGWNTSFGRLKDKMLNANSELKVCFDIDPVDVSDGITAISIYRIVCEGCQNIMKHSFANVIEVSVKNIEDFVRVCIRDNGVGMRELVDFPKNHFGLQLISERVEALSGKIKLISGSSGTLIEISIPIGEGLKKNDSYYDRG